MENNIKTLRVCLSNELPDISKRDPNFMYFLYNKLILFMGQSLFNDPYCIVPEMPEYPVAGMLYIDFGDGTVKSYIDNSIIEIARVESEEQNELLKQSGTVFFVNADKRYLDIQRRIVTLPYLNGKYILTVDVASNLILDKNTVLRFNPETNQFEIIGDTVDYIPKPFKDEITGSETNSAITKVDNYVLGTDIRVSPAFDNILKIFKDGLYASASDRVPVKEFNTWKNNFEEYKLKMESYLEELSEKIYDMGGDFAPDSINAKIKEAIEKIYPEIDAAIDTLVEMADKFAGIEQRTKQYTDQKFNAAQEDLENAIVDATNNPWELLT